MNPILDQRAQNTLMRGPRPSTFEAYKALKATTVIDLETGAFEWLHGRRGEEDAWAKQSGVVDIHQPQSFIFKPSNEAVHTFIEIVDKGLNLGSVFFHCKEGVDRTGYMAAAYRILVQRWDPGFAIKEMLTWGFHECRYWFWIDGLRRLK